MPVERIARVTGAAVALRGDDIDTDRIIPARFLKAVTFDGLEAHLFEDDRRQAESNGVVHPLSDPRHGSASILLVQSNFGCGSSREHAPQAIRRRGIRAIVGQSFSEIFFGNAVALGLPCPSASREVIDALMAVAEADPDAPFDVDLDRLVVSAGGRDHPIALPAAIRDAFLDGSWDATGLLLEDYGQVTAVAGRLPYIRGY
jgi:3-isopropylmalate/(R)-2-methylmalate dehydratase small subunit